MIPPVSLGCAPFFSRQGQARVVQNELLSPQPGQRSGCLLALNLFLNSINQFALQSQMCLIFTLNQQPGLPIGHSTGVRLWHNLNRRASPITWGNSTLLLFILHSQSLGIKTKPPLALLPSFPLVSSKWGKSRSSKNGCKFCRGLDGFTCIGKDQSRTNKEMSIQWPFVLPPRSTSGQHQQTWGNPSVSKLFSSWEHSLAH